MSSQLTKKVRLISSDQTYFLVDEIAAITSITIKNLVDNVEGDIFIPKVTADVLGQVIEWGLKQTVKRCRDQEDQEEWEKQFLDMDTDSLYHLFMAADYLENQSLLDAVAKKVASLIMGESPEQIRQTFKIKSDFSAEEEQVFRKNNAWALDD